MKVLVRKYGNEQFVYANLTYENGNFKTEDGHTVEECNIVHIAKDTRKNKVRCNSCGLLIENSPEAIEAHFKAMENEKNCLTCSSVVESYRKKTVGKKYKPNPDEPGKYIFAYTFSGDLFCGCNRSATINTPEADEVCKYLRCRHSGVSEFSDFFTTYPAAFTDFPTVDKLLEKKWVFERFNYGNAIYHHNRLTTLKAVVNNKGIINNFRAYYKRNDWVDMVYSDKYDKVFYIRNSRYSERSPSDMIDSKVASYTARIKELY